ncbi:MAG: hypothetical protein HY814_03785 [Candidatus Riflebacteria bacterium]|nr:hypothetical protein [Candidatus Riflebacteria bacterium]
MTDATKKIVIAGDPAVDWDLAREREYRRDTGSWTRHWSDDTRTRVFQRKGGVWGVKQLIAKLLAGPTCQVFGPEIPESEIGASSREFIHSYTMWAPHPREKVDGRDSKEKVWRISEFMSYELPSVEMVDKSATWGGFSSEPEEAELVILDDANKGFRNPTSERHWPRALGKGKRPWIILKMGEPVAEGALWENLIEQHHERLIVVMTANDLRRADVHVSRGLSWEQTAQDLAQEITLNQHINVFSGCHATVVSFDTSGAFLADGASGKCRLFFEPESPEDGWSKDYPGWMVGYTTCLVAGLAAELLHEEPDLKSGIQAGINGMRALHKAGFGKYEGLTAPISLGFPCEEAVQALRHPAEKLASVEIELPRSEDVPLGVFGKLLTVDRREIEAYRSILNLLTEYRSKVKNTKPLSIAVFGPPGSGKSFGVKQLAASALKDERVELEFNLSQFKGPEDLIASFHQIRDVALSGKFPLVFWDEFDTSLGGQQFVWLRYFLAPMQDGKFQEGQVMHPLGRCMFVFAGGTCRSIREFGRPQQAVNPTTEGQRSESTRAGGEDADFKKAKGPDFRSRLSGFVDILGPNPARSSVDADDAGSEESTSSPAKTAESAGTAHPRLDPRDEDPHYIVRRAILFRSILERDAPGIFAPGDRRDKHGTANVSEGVIRAFLEVPKYEHGARSMEALLAMSSLRGRCKFELSCLPAGDQLRLHVDPTEFLSLAHNLEFDEETVEKLAARVHEGYCNALKAEGYVYGEVTDEDAHTSALLCNYEQLPEADQEPNRQVARGFPWVVRRAGCLVRRRFAGEEPLDLSRGALLEALSAAEHERWMRQKQKDGWRYGELSDRAAKTNKWMQPYENLPDEIKERDRNNVRLLVASLENDFDSSSRPRRAGAGKALRFARTLAPAEQTPPK